jgi:prepilin-type N-terminal cleavage/methylation domain-containing protein
MQRTRHGFTLLEMLISLTIIALLISFVAVAVKGVRGAAEQTGSLNALRNIQSAYNSYTVESKSVLMPGFADTTLLGQLDLKAQLDTGLDLTAPAFCNGSYCDGSSYVWRLAPFMDDNWSVFHTDYQDEGIESQLVTEYGLGSDSDAFGLASVSNGQIGIGAGTAFGLNSMFFGGDTRHGDDDVVALNPFSNPGNSIAATRLSEVRNASRAIVFGATALGPGTSLPGDPQFSNVQLGYVELRPPWGIPPADIGDPEQRWGAPMWSFNDLNAIISADDDQWANGGGVPVARAGDNRVPVSHIDGGTELINLFELGPNPNSFDTADQIFMRRWSPFAIGVDPGQ